MKYKLRKMLFERYKESKMSLKDYYDMECECSEDEFIECYEDFDEELVIDVINEIYKSYKDFVEFIKSFE